MKNFIRNYFAEFGLALAAAVAILVAILASVWEWIENPGGIFHNSEGTNWQFVFETAWSWWIPTFVYTVVLASLAHLTWVSVAWVLKKLTNRRDSI